jgi:hypothetical protein
MSRQLRIAAIAALVALAAAWVMLRQHNAQVTAPAAAEATP